MTLSRDEIPTPFWPRLLSREEAARYVGLSPNQFIEEVEAGTFPPAVKMLRKTVRALWDRLELDSYLDAQSDFLGKGDIGYEARKAAWHRP